MIGKSRRECIEDMSSEVEVPFGIAKKCIKLAHGGVEPFVAPCEPPILKVNLLELTILEGYPESIKVALIHISLVFISCSINLVKISEG